MIIGITGMSGSGKNFYSELFCKINPSLKHIDIDEVGHKVLAEDDIAAQLVLAFGNDIITNGIVDRKKLGNIVFNNREKYSELCKITWDRMKMYIDEEIRLSKDNCILNWILLPQVDYFKMCSLKILVKRNTADRYSGIILRDNITIEKVKERDGASIKYNEEDFDIIIGDSV
jgi:dephospho-CoA kinase